MSVSLLRKVLLNQSIDFITDVDTYSTYTALRNVCQNLNVPDDQTDQILAAFNDTMKIEIDKVRKAREFVFLVVEDMDRELNT